MWYPLLRWVYVWYPLLKSYVKMGVYVVSAVGSLGNSLIQISSPTIHILEPLLCINLTLWSHFLPSSQKITAIKDLYRKETSSAWSDFVHNLPKICGVCKV